MTTFPAEVVRAVLRHMNEDHTEDSLTIVRAYAEPEASAATMTGLDGAGGTWDAQVRGRTVSVTVPWTEPAVERADLRREVVRLHERALERLGQTPTEVHP
ncbi:DUF2470 domain-containing protein [Aeromicrobium sp. SMF47]|uniref:DUF2470 domain-containing protein n=1 Tax=Aeromicrobium yanjiei TaxID=2662028 RepID=A0A5Q2MIS3_9ACTN|nr:DUF2470 domain-containing protein [Aeromicrobium yanjiei]MRJ75742.1 DUF2470 domain-containing protein [Aeromicrobium yanjiei]QGG43007.1 DUF2470 domain-containing protein [Aeromicrobium yanjiei]